MVTHEEILKIARLAKLSVAPEELDSLTKDMNSIIEFADAVNSVAAEDSDFDNSNSLSNVFREDKVVPSYDREEILKNAPNQEDGYFLVRRRM
ncbi:Glutamyl-tRNA(Gln) amidotransferase subunit C [Caprobacter fermentans]|uniref:Aspartyl/glutamyl-tRNA(Asn/Gln) amidotransferase subunit C n=1 Tax=Caproicibacter fermentans TaxID=2576756 RepID=A0A6N8HXD9_9FIRM|nr:Asp-tRNA(Asn)/Glu-tRNA(Gln) amidotransferase subunit GatC [Caproicibacter fermentans]MVB10412.1 Glutamyl-tRNA(Gln) amidotransferase subunit C [Caproicibacter fermentans]OCN01888.1 glutamyl-tRNA amidotransferase [Clostridium sp. W14A]QNK40368.1 Asp-tRNA(Asn)/Glu-tRNA(Gln) amidotransferase subunit GatC [Caproicibacter fermentans]